MAGNTTVVWLRHDLRLADQPALVAAVRRRGPVVPLFVWEADDHDPWPPGAASRWWLHHSLAALEASLLKRGSKLILRRGGAVDELLAAVRSCRAAAVVWNRRWEPAAMRRDQQVAAALADAGIDCAEFDGNLMCDPTKVLTAQRQPYQVFTPFWRAASARGESSAESLIVLPAPRKLPPPSQWPRSVRLVSLGLLPRTDWAFGLRAFWQPGELGAQRRLRRFLGHAAERYPQNRDRPDLDGVSCLSPHLHFGEISPRQVRTAVYRALGQGDPADALVRQLYWREFACYLLTHFPHTPQSPLRKKFDRFPWSAGGPELTSWQQGRTGYPIVDAGMRQLWNIGWMHNRVRMIAASFLVKHLLVSWLDGARWFWDTLVDADLANNTLGWQWTAGCGADAAPYFRIFNPVAQGQRYDPRGDYVRRWVPELGNLPAQWIHHPWEAPHDVLARAGVCLGENYPYPIVDHRQARRRALAALARTARTP